MGGHGFDHLIKDFSSRISITSSAFVIILEVITTMGRVEYRGNKVMRHTCPIYLYSQLIPIARPPLLLDHERREPILAEARLSLVQCQVSTS